MPALTSPCKSPGVIFPFDGKLAWGVYVNLAIVSIVSSDLMPNFNILILWRLDQHKLLSERTGGPDIFAEFPKCKAKGELKRGV